MQTAEHAKADRPATISWRSTLNTRKRVKLAAFNADVTSEAWLQEVVEAALGTAERGNFVNRGRRSSFGPQPASHQRGRRRRDSGGGGK